MTSRRASLLVVLCPLLPCCGGDTAEFGEARSLPKAQRPTEWDVPAKARLDVREMTRPAEPALPERVVADLPAGWEEQQAQPQRFRDAVWRVAGDASTECYLTLHAGGGEAANLARWYGQFAATPGTAPLPAVELLGRSGKLLELAGSYQGTPGMAMLLAYTVDGDALTTLKFTGPVATVTAQRAAFFALLRSLRRAPGAAPGTGPGAGTEPPTGQLPPGHGPVTPLDAPFVATTPSGWTPKTSARLLHHAFGQDGEVYVAQLSGDLRAMFDIWRGEVGQQAALTDAEWQALPKVALLGGEGRLLDVRGDWRGMSGKQIAGARLWVAARIDDGAITFVKLVGPAAEVEAQSAAFTEFCASLRRAP